MFKPNQKENDRSIENELIILKGWLLLGLKEEVIETIDSE